MWCLQGGGVSRVVVSAGWGVSRVGLSPGWWCLRVVVSPGWGVSRVALPVWQLLMEEICSWLPECRGAKIIYIVGMSNCHSHEEPVYVVR